MRFNRNLCGEAKMPREQRAPMDKEGLATHKFPEIQAWGGDMRGRFAAVIAILSLVFSQTILNSPAFAQERSATRPGFSLSAQSGVRILLLRPTIKAGAQSTGGLFEPNADWTSQARDNIGAALTRAQAGLGNRIIVQSDVVGDQAQVLADYMALFSAVAQSVINYQFFRGNRLPTKRRDNAAGNFDWTLGPGVASIPGASDADYALFIYTEDQYGSVGRKVFQILAAATVHVAVRSGVHKGFAGLIDLRTGNLVWLNADMAMGGDVRTPEGAQRRVGQLLEDFPGASVAPAARAQ